MFLNRVMLCIKVPVEVNINNNRNNVKYVNNIEIFSKYYIIRSIMQ